MKQKRGTIAMTAPLSISYFKLLSQNLYTQNSFAGYSPASTKAWILSTTLWRSSG